MSTVVTANAIQAQMAPPMLILPSECMENKFKKQSGQGKNQTYVEKT